MEIFWRAVAQQAPADDPRDDLGGSFCRGIMDGAPLIEIRPVRRRPFFLNPLPPTSGPCRCEQATT